MGDDIWVKIVVMDLVWWWIDMEWDEEVGK